MKGSKVKLPVYSDFLSELKPLHIAGGSKSLFVVSQEGKVSSDLYFFQFLVVGHHLHYKLKQIFLVICLWRRYKWPPWPWSQQQCPIPQTYSFLESICHQKSGCPFWWKTCNGFNIGWEGEENVFQLLKSINFFEQVFSWGEGEDGKLGHGNRLNLDKPKMIDALRSKKIREIACGSSHSAAITSNGELYTWGLGEYGRLGHGDNVTQLKPKMVGTKSSYLK